jgi:hypothetical protein
MFEYYHFLEDENELKWFYDHCIPSLKEDEVFFLSLSARNKQLSEEERKFYSLGRSEMFGKQVIRKDSYETIFEHVLRYESRIGSWQTRINKPIPQKCMIVYWNINPSSTRKVITDTFEHINELQGELTNAALKNSKVAIDSAFHKIKKYFDSIVSLYARNEGTKYWLDIDVDVEKKEFQYNYLSIHYYLLSKLGIGNFVEIETKGGIHILVKRIAIKFNPQEIVDEISKIFQDAKDININHNAMIPLPGTNQAGFTVRILNKDEFVKENNIK